MSDFVMLTRLAAQPALASNSGKETAMARIRSACPKVEWVFNRRIPGPYDYMDVFCASGPSEAAEAADIAREIGPARIELWTVEELMACNALIRYFG